MTLSRIIWFALLGLICTGCCSDRSLIKHDMTDAQVIKLSVEQFDGMTTQNERFQAAAQMVDWSGVYPSSFGGPYFPAVYWDSETKQMMIPVYRCLYGLKRPRGFAVLQFDSDGELINAHLDQERFMQLPSDSFDRAHKKFDDPWGKQESLRHTLMVNLRSDDMQPKSTYIRMPRSDREEISRVVEISYRTSSYTRSSFSDALVIQTEPQVDFLVLDDQGSVIRTNPLFNAYIVQDDDFTARSGSWRPKSSRDKPFPEFEAHYLIKILLAPHEGVALSVGIVESEATQ
jgi:hypothetical protein